MFRCPPNLNITTEDFILMFPEFSGIAENFLESALARASVFISIHKQNVGLTPHLHRLGVMLAIAHCLYEMPDGKKVILLNGYDSSDLAGVSNVIMATQGSVSIMKKTYSPANAGEAQLLNTKYGELLINLINSAQPEVVVNKTSAYPYYPAVGYGFDPLLGNEIGEIYGNERKRDSK